MHNIRRKNSTGFALYLSVCNNLVWNGIPNVTYLLQPTAPGQAGWGIAWYINNTLIPELVVERGRTYTFLVYGGANSADSSNYHPFYITDSIHGGRLLNTPQERTVRIVIPFLLIHDIIDLYVINVGVYCIAKSN